MSLRSLTICGANVDANSVWDPFVPLDDATFQGLLRIRNLDTLELRNFGDISRFLLPSNESDAQDLPIKHLKIDAVLVSESLGLEGIIHACKELHSFRATFNAHGNGGSSFFGKFGETILREALKSHRHTLNKIDLVQIFLTAEDPYVTLGGNAKAMDFSSFALVKEMTLPIEPHLYTFLKSQRLPAGLEILQIQCHVLNDGVGSIASEDWESLKCAISKLTLSRRSTGYLSSLRRIILWQQLRRNHAQPPSEEDGALQSQELNHHARTSQGKVGILDEIRTTLQEQSITFDVIVAAHVDETPMRHENGWFAWKNGGFCVLA